MGRQPQSFDRLRTGLLNDGVRSYAYDHANRLVQVVSGTSIPDSAHPSTLLRAGSGAGDRVSKIVDGVTQGSRTSLPRPLPAL